MRLELRYAVCLSAVLRIHERQKLCGPPDGTDHSLTRITASPLLVGSETTSQSSLLPFVVVLLNRTPASI